MILSSYINNKLQCQGKSIIENEEAMDNETSTCVMRFVALPLSPVFDMTNNMSCYWISIADIVDIRCGAAFNPTLVCNIHIHYDAKISLIYYLGSIIFSNIFTNTSSNIFSNIFSNICSNRFSNRFSLSMY